ncbi:MAG: serine/threonine protein kinase [Gemmatimonadetes bacterium]|nr:serine/threonine protein kinase [Gemmatimonadota bacterium]
MPEELSPQDIEQRLTRALGPKYEVRRLLGRGGFAEVYEVWDKDLERRLAVKVLRPDVAWTPGMLDRFRHETKAVARFSHPNILAIHFVGEGEGIVYYAMPFVEGQSLADLLRKEGRLPYERVVSLARQILDALQHAHDSGLLHRDIKPDNIMIDRAIGKPLLVDFGIAKRLDAGKGMTQTGFVVGTPQYMSPEQALGDTKLDARSDLYSMGAVLFQMLTGAPPFEGETSQEVVAKHIAEPPPAPLAANPQVPQWLSDAVVRCLAKKPSERFQSAAEMLGALEQGMASMPPLAVSRAQASAAVGATVKIESGRRRAATAPEVPAAAAAPAASAAAARPWLWAILGVVAAAGGAGAYVILTRPVLVFENRLLEPVRIVAGPRERVVEPGTTLRVPLRRRMAAVAEWRMLRPTSPRGEAMGVEVRGSLALDHPRGRVRRAAEARGTAGAFFAPLITNNTGQPISITVNAGLAGALSCHCTVLPGTSRARIGYYLLYQNSTVRAEDPQGRTATFTDLGPQVDRGTGMVSLRFGPTDLRRR